MISPQTLGVAAAASLAERSTAPLGPCETPPARVLFGIPFHDVTFTEAVAWCVARMESGRPGYVATANVDFLMQAWRDPELQRILLEADLVVADGQPIVWASRFFGPRLRERVTGSDLVPMLATACAGTRHSMFLLGGAEGVAGRAAEVLCDANPGLKMAGTFSPPPASVLDMDHADILARISQASPDLLLVAFGAPKQEKFINMHLREWAVPLAIGVGGTLDFLAGAQTRAPGWIRRTGLEWLWRMASNPRRLLRRYAGNIAFLLSSCSRLFALRCPLPEREQRIREQTNWPACSARMWNVTSAPPAPENRPANLVLNLEHCNWLDSAALGVVVTVAREQRQRGGRLLVCGGTARARRFLRACRLDAYLLVCESQEEVDSSLRLWFAESRNGKVFAGANALRLCLPAELTSSSLHEWASRVDADWGRTVARIEIDASRLDYVDSTGLGWLVSIRNRCAKEQVRFVCRGFQGRALQTLHVARLDKLFAGG